MAVFPNEELICTRGYSLYDLGRHASFTQRKLSY